MNKVLDTAYSYIRFSSKQQAKGHSLKRQTDLARDYCNKNSLILDTSLDLSDLGISGYSGANIRTGALGKFIELVSQGNIAKGSYLLIENLDRFSRLNPKEIQPIFQQLLNSGIRIVTLTDNKVFDENSDFVDMIVSILGMQRAYEESNRKSQLVRTAKANKMQQVIDGNTDLKLSRNCPKWLILSDDRKSFTKIKDRIEVVQKVYQMSIDGLGSYKITQWLNANVEPWEHLGTSLAKTIRWKKPYMLGNRCLLGEMLGIKDYYPQIISNEVFDKELYLRGKRNTGGSKGRTGKNFTNLFIGLAKCYYSEKGLCGTNKKDEIYSFVGSRKYPALECYAKRTGTCKRFKGDLWKYKGIEELILQHLGEVDFNELLQSDLDPESTNQLATLQIKKDSLSSDYQKIQASMFEFEELPKFLIDKSIQLEKEIKQLDKEINILEVEGMQMQTSKSEIFYMNDINAIGKDYVSRAKFNQLLKRYIEVILIKGYVQDREIIIKFKNGVSQTISVDKDFDSLVNIKLVGVATEKLIYEHPDLDVSVEVDVDKRG